MDTLAGGRAQSCADAAAELSVTVVIPAFTLDRWELLERAAASAQQQTRVPAEVVICVDRNRELLARCRRRWPADEPGEPPIRVVASFTDDGNLLAAEAHRRAHGSSRRFGAGWARNTATGAASGDVVAFLDDDAEAAPDWLEHLLEPYAQPEVLAVGGAPLPRFETARPPWFPHAFDWVFGCAYDGLPGTTAPLPHLIGANMSVRRSALRAIGGFHSIDFDDLDMCMRLEQLHRQSVWYQPRAVVHHFVPDTRVHWRYFYRRCYVVNREKVLAFKEMGTAANLAAERSFVLRTLASGLAGELRRGPRAWGVARIAAAFIGIAAAGLGHLAGRVRYLEVRHAAE